MQQKQVKNLVVTGKLKQIKIYFNNIKNRKTLREKAFDYILNGNKNFKEIIDKIDGKEVQFRRISAREYIYGTNAQKLSNQNYNKKMRLAPSIDDLILMLL